MRGALANRSLVVPLVGLLGVAATAHAGGGWALWAGEPGKEASGTRASTHGTLAECLDERKSWEERRRAYLRAANEARPQDQLPQPVPADSYRCLPDPGDPKPSRAR